MGDEVILELIEVSKRYAGADTVTDLPILRGLNLQIHRGETVSIVGPSGSGKTTLLNLLGTLDRPDGGTIRLAGEDLSRLDEAGLARVRNREIGFIFQFHFLLPHLTLLENVLLPTLTGHARAGGSSAPERAHRLLERVGLSHRLQHRPGQLSGGERQRAAVVRALINQPKLLLADEPTGALDQRSAQELGQLLVELNQEEGVTLVVVTHSMELARQMGRVLELRNGTLNQES